MTTTATTKAATAAFLQQVRTGKTRSMAARIFRLLRTEPMDIQQIGDHLDIRPSTVTARLSQLRELGLIRPISDRISGSSTYTVYAATPPAGRDQAALSYLKERYLAKLRDLTDDKYAGVAGPNFRLCVRSELRRLGK